jgi:hypothetical protein
MAILDFHKCIEILVERILLLLGKIVFCLKLQRRIFRLLLKISNIKDNNT